MAAPNCCEGCLKWEQFGNKCWVYWEEKKECTQKADSVDEMPLQ